MYTPRINHRYKGQISKFMIYHNPDFHLASVWSIILCHRHGKGACLLKKGITWRVIYKNEWLVDDRHEPIYWAAMQLCICGTFVWIAMGFSVMQIVLDTIDYFRKVLSFSTRRVALSNCSLWAVSKYQISECSYFMNKVPKNYSFDENQTRVLPSVQGLRAMRIIQEENKSKPAKCEQNSHRMGFVPLSIYSAKK